MRFYLDLPLVLGYVLMATTACLGMLQLAAARGGYAGLSLFTADREQGARVGAGLTVGALLAYVLFAPEILTPGPAGSEVAQMFALCALVALAVTLLGADRRLARTRGWQVSGGEPITLGDLPATLHPPLPAPPDRAPAVVLLPDPAGLVVAPQALVEAFCQAGIAVLALDARGVAASDAPPFGRVPGRSRLRQTLLGHLATALAGLARQPGIDAERVGLLGLGLGGDAALQAAVTDPQLRAALAVSPVGDATPGTGEAGPGLHWLHELSYLQVWRWRRRWPALRRAATDLQPPGSPPVTPSVNLAVLQGNSTILTMRKAQPEIEPLTVPGQRHFTLLQDTQARQLAVAWFQEKLECTE